MGMRHTSIRSIMGAVNASMLLLMRGVAFEQWHLRHQERTADLLFKNNINEYKWVESVEGAAFWQDVGYRLR